MNTAQHILARRYAQAYLHLFGAQITDHTIVQLKAFVAWYLRHAHGFSYLDLASFSAQAKIQLVMRSAARFELQQLEKLVTLLAQQNRLGLLVPVLQTIIALYQHEHHRTDVVLTSAHQLTDAEQRKLQQFFEQKTGQHSTIVAKLDPRLIAGVRLQSDTFLWEHSVAKQLRAVRAYAGHRRGNNSR